MRHCTDADRPVLVTADGPTYINVPEDTGELSSDDEPLVNIAKASQQIGSCNSPEVVTVSDLFGSCSSPEIAIASDLTDPDWHEDTVQPSTSEDDGEPLICLTRKSRKRKNITFHRELETAKATSVQTVKRLECELEVHRSKLDNILSANGYCRRDVALDGNCFFESVSAHLDGIDALVLRSCLCDYLDSNFAAYIEFLTGDTDNENDRYLRYFLNVEQLRTPGTWSNDAGDLLPLALADWSRRTVKIFTSNLYRPVIIVHPQDINNESQCEITPITLSLLELEAPHYETVFPLSPKRFSAPAFSSNTPGIQVPESENTTPDKTLLHSSPGTRQASLEQEASTPPARFPPHMETARKQRTFKTPPRKELFRRKLAVPNQWKKNSRKVLRLKGKEYISESGKMRPSKMMVPTDCTKCRFECSRISKEKRKELFQSFYSLKVY